MNRIGLSVSSALLFFLLTACNGNNGASGPGKQLDGSGGSGGGAMYDLDLDQDGVMDSHLTWARCPASPHAICGLLSSSIPELDGMAIGIDVLVSANPNPDLLPIGDQHHYSESGITSQNCGSPSNYNYELHVGDVIPVGKQSGTRFQNLFLTYYIPTGCTLSADGSAVYYYFRPVVKAFELATGSSFADRIALAEAPWSQPPYFLALANSGPYSWRMPARSVYLHDSSNGFITPVFLPSYGDENGQYQWGHACALHIGAPANPYCEGGFDAIDITPHLADPTADEPQFGTWFNEGGAAVIQPVPGTTRERFVAIYHRCFVIGNADSQTSETYAYNAATADPVFSAQNAAFLASFPFFNGGRNYGWHTFGAQVDIIFGSLSIANWKLADTYNDLAGPNDPNDANCNVTRFLAVAKTYTAPSDNNLIWSQYYGFASNTFQPVDGKYPVCPASNPSCYTVVRKGDFMNGCTHAVAFTDDGTGQELMVVNIFTTALTGQCMAQQYLALATSWASGPYQAWLDCQKGTLASDGEWRTRGVRVATGEIVYDVPGYDWGVVESAYPGVPLAHLIEHPTSASYEFLNLANDLPHTKNALEVMALGANNHWMDLGPFPVDRNGDTLRPVVTRRTPGANEALEGTYEPGVITGAIRNDDLVSIRVTDSNNPVEADAPEGSRAWAGYNPASGQWEIQ